MDQPPQSRMNLLHPLKSLEWSECCEMPVSVYEAQAVVLGNKVYIGGGIIYPGSSSRLLVYNFTKDSWDIMDTPTEDYAITTYHSQLVLLGGRNPNSGQATNQLWVLDKQHQWTKFLPSMTTQRFRACAVSMGDHLIVAGGCCDNQAFPRDQDEACPQNLDTVELYDGHGHHWRRVQSLPKPGSQMKSVLFEGNWYLAVEMEQHSEIYWTSVESLIATSECTRQTSVWKKLLCKSLELSTLSFLKGRLITAGGRNVYNSAIYAYCTTTNCWVHVGDLPVACCSPYTVVLPTGELLVGGGDTDSEVSSCLFKASIIVTSFPGGYFDMSALDRLEKVAGIIIFNKLAPKFLEIASALHFHESTVDSLTVESNPAEGLKAMFEAWLSGYSPLPPTWQSLMEIFHTVQMEQLAQNIQHFFNRTVVPSSSASLISENKKEELGLDLFAIEPNCRDMAVQKSPDHQEVAVQKSPDYKEVAVQKSPDYQEVAVQKSPDYQEVAVQKSPDYQEIAVQKNPDHQEVAVQKNPDYQEVAVQKNPDHQEVAVQKNPDHQEVAVQNSPDYKEVAVQTAVAVNSVGLICGVEVIGETEFTVPTQGGLFEWKGYGLRLHVPKGSLTASMGECRINIQVSLSGQFQLPKDSDFLSPVFWLSASCKFTKPVILEIQHCTFQENETVLSDLSFVSAKCSQKDLPYTFRQVDGGVFTTHSSYGSIQLSHFSGFAVTGRKSTPRSYCAHLYQTMKQMYDWRFYFVITQDLEVVREHYGHFARKEAALRVSFESSKITLDIPEDGMVTKKGWRITPFTSPSISKKDADHFVPGQWIPECQLIVEWEGEEQRPVRLRHKVDLIGAKAPFNFIHLILNPELEEMVRHQSTSSVGSMEYSQAGLHSNYPAGLQSQPELSFLMNKVAAEIPSKWRDVGLQLGVDHGVLEGIALISPGDTNLCYSNVFTRWKNQNSATYPYTWLTLVQALESQAVGEKRLADKIRNEVTGHLLQ